MNQIKNLILFNIILFVSIILSGCSGCKNEQEIIETPQSVIPQLQFTITKELPHDTTAFTEGLFISNNTMYESTGGTLELPQTKSLYGVYDSITGKIKNKVVLDKNKYFGEGITMLHDKIYQLTYQTKIGFVYDANSHKQLKTFAIPSAEGWGFTNDGTNLIMSDGTNTLTFLDPESLSVVNKISVTEDNYALNNLNELEFLNGFIYANIYTTNNIVKIDASSGKVVAKMDCSSLAQAAKNKYYGSLEMNGIAYNKANNKFYVTGKMWPIMYELALAN
jgi:glutaminyl-peptide cyclotransferase